ncbi:MAG: LlaJI family restriction endonuclease [Planctomycetota bacterium]
MQPRTYVSDGQPEQRLAQNVIAVLEDEGLLELSGSGKGRVVAFCGFVVTSDAILVALPKTLEVPTEDDIDLCRLLYRTFVRFLRQDVPTIESGSADMRYNKEDLANLSTFQIYDELLDDCARFGIYRNRIKTQRLGLSGRPNWKKTLKKVMPYHNGRGVPIYPYFHTERRDLRLEGLVSDIHRWCVSNADHAIGWLKSSGGDTVLFPSIAHSRGKAPCDRKAAIHILTAELRKCYEQRKIRLLNLMIKLLDQTDTGVSIEQKQFGVRYFWPVWESICKAYLSDQSEEHGKALPQPSYRTGDGVRYNRGRNIGQRPDVVIGSPGDALAVIDAKYYDVRKGVPGWQDIVKQLFYAASYKTTGYASEVRNVLMFPEPESTSLPDKIVMDIPDEVRTGEQFDETRFNSLFPPIECRYLSMTKAMKAYACKAQGETLRACLLETELDNRVVGDA